MSHEDVSTWTLIAMHDEAGRRGVWYRADIEPGSQVNTIELCAGREGGDDFVRLRIGETLTYEKMQKLLQLLSTGSWMTYTYGPFLSWLPTPNPDLTR